MDPNPIRNPSSTGPYIQFQPKSHGIRISKSNPCKIHGFNGLFWTLENQNQSEINGILNLKSKSMDYGFYGLENKDILIHNSFGPSGYDDTDIRQ